MAAAITAPLFPAEIKASALLLFNNFVPTTIEESLLFRIASKGNSPVSMYSLQFMTDNLFFLYLHFIHTEQDFGMDFNEIDVEKLQEKKLIKISSKKKIIISEKEEIVFICDSLKKLKK